MLTPESDAPEPTPFGWTFYTTKRKHSCITCNRKNLRVGVVNIAYVGLEDDPGFRIMCRGCFYALDPVEVGE